MIFSLASLLPVSHAQAFGEGASRLTLQPGTPLHVRIDQTVSLRQGVIVKGHITESVYAYDQLVIPEGAAIEGVVTELIPIGGELRAKALLNGDVTSLKEPRVTFNTIHLASGDISLSSEGIIRETQLVRFQSAAKQPSLMQQAKAEVSSRISNVRTAIVAPGKQDRALRLLYRQLPYHPQRLWAGTQIIADLKAPLDFTPQSQVNSSLTTKLEKLDGTTITARLTTPLSSDTTRKGTAVIAMSTQPLFDDDHHLLLPEGSQLEGVVSQVKPSRSFGRNGQLRFAFQSVQRRDEPEQNIHGLLSGAEGSQSQNLSVDAEGNTKANPDKNRFLAPALLGVLAVGASHGDSDGSGLGRNTLASNGFGLIARVITLTLNDQNVASGFGYYALAKSIYFRFLTKGNPVTFPAGTLVEMELTGCPAPQSPEAGSQTAKPCRVPLPQPHRIE